MARYLDKQPVAVENTPRVVRPLWITGTIHADRDSGLPVDTIAACGKPVPAYLPAAPLNLETSSPSRSVCPACRLPRLPSGAPLSLFAIRDPATLCGRRALHVPSGPTPSANATVASMTAESVTQDPAQLRAAMVAKLREKGYIRTPEVAAAFERVPREQFAPSEPLDKTYDMWSAVITKMGEHGRATSSISAPWLQAQMIEDARIRPGDRILEVGSGGCNAAMLAEMTGARGSVVTIDIDPWVTERASRFINRTGYTNVLVVTGDAEATADTYGPFDAIIVTVGAWDTPWAQLLTEGGRMVVPIIVATHTRSVTFTRRGNRWDGTNPVVCGFVTMQGAGYGYDQNVHLGGQKVHVSVEGGPALDHDALERALAGAMKEAWTGVTKDDQIG